MSEKEFGVQQSLLAVSGELHFMVCERAGQPDRLEHRVWYLRQVIDGRREATHATLIEATELVGFGYVEVLGVDPNDLDLRQELLGVLIELVDAGFPVGYLPLLFAHVVSSS